MRDQDRFRIGTIPPLTLMAGALIGILALLGYVAIPSSDESAAMEIAPHRINTTLGDIFTTTIVVRSPVPVNVFSGEIHFDPRILEVSAIDYNTSIADLWAEKPWYENGAGTINFIGGTTRPGGFIGTGELITIHYRAHGEGVGTVSILDAHILKHDGLGTEAPLHEPLDALYTVAVSEAPNLVLNRVPESSYSVFKEPPSPDLNQDGAVTFADTSILLMRLASDDVRYDLNQDGEVDMSDVFFLMQTP